MRQVIEFPTAEGEVAKYLRARIPQPVLNVVPDRGRPAEFVFVRRTGGARRGVVVDQAMLTIECWSSDDASASQLAQFVRAHLGAIAGRWPGVSRYVEFSGPASLPDPNSGQARYTWTVSVDFRGHAI